MHEKIGLPVPEKPGSLASLFTRSNGGARAGASGFASNKSHCQSLQPQPRIKVLLPGVGLPLDTILVL